MELSLLKQERLKRGWSRAKVEALTERRIIQVSLERWEDNKSWPRSDNIEELCKLYGKNARELGLDRSGDIIMGGNINAPTSQEETPMSEIIRRAAFYDLGSKLSSLIDVWPKRDYHYEELQGEINKAILDYNALSGQDSIYEVNRRQVLKSVGLVPIQLCAGLDGVINLNKAKADTDTVLKHCAAGIAVCWYMRRGKELVFTSDLISEYIKVLRQLVYSKSEMHRKAGAGLLTQSFMLKGSLTKDITGDRQATEYGEQAVQYGTVADDPLIQAIAHRMMCNFYYPQENYTESVRSAERATSLINGNMDKGVQSFIYAGLASSQSADGKSDQALASLKKARDLFDPTRPLPIHVQFSEGTLLFESGLVHRDLGHWVAATSDFDQAITRCVSITGKIQKFH